MIDYSNCEKSLRHLALQYAHYVARDESLPEYMQEALAESVIHRFETAYDCVWKALKRYLVEKLGIPNASNSPKPIFRIAAENNVLQSFASQWIEYANARIAASHDYSLEKAQRCLAHMDDFLRDAMALYETLSGKPIA